MQIRVLMYCIIDRQVRAIGDTFKVEEDASYLIAIGRVQAVGDEAAPADLEDAKAAEAQLQIDLSQATE
jgi:hypothetical protein